MVFSFQWVARPGQAGSASELDYFVNASSMVIPSCKRFHSVPYLMPRMSAHSGIVCVSPFQEIFETLRLFLCCYAIVIQRQFSGQ